MRPPERSHTPPPPAAGSDATAPPDTTTAPAAASGSGGEVDIAELAEVDQPVGIAVRPGDDRLFVISRAGKVLPVSTGGDVGDPVLDIAALVTAGGEQGLLGLAFHPSEPLAYVDYTDAAAGDTRIDEFTVGPDGTMDPASRREVLKIDQPYANHNGGQLAFGPDGYLYIGMGDGGSGGDPERRGLDMDELLGKILRIDPRRSGGEAYSVPADNPFVDTAGARPEIWTLGMRNPWRFSFDPATGDLWIADVGQGEWEEIDVAWADEGGGRGVNFGWSAFEGTHRFNEDQPTRDAVDPIFEYDHSDGNCSVSGGAISRTAALPGLAGWYVYGDFCAGQVRALQIVDRAVAKEVELGNAPSISSVGVGPDGALYVTSVEGNAVYAIRPA